MKLVQTQKTDAMMRYLKENEIINLNIIGKIENNDSLPIFTDNPENPNGVLVKAGYMHFLYTESDTFIDAVLEEHMAEGFFGFAGLEKNLAARIKEKEIVMWSNPCSIYAYMDDSVELIDGTYDLRTIAAEDAETVDKFYEYRGAHSLEEIRRDIKFRPSSAVYVDNEPVCWVLVHEDNSMGIMYTKEEHRRKGLAEVVSRDLTRRILSEDQIPYLQIVDGNEKSHGLAKKCGFEKVGDCEWFGIIKGHPQELKEMGDQALKAFEAIYGQRRFETAKTYNVRYFTMLWLDQAEVAGVTARKLQAGEDYSTWTALIDEPCIPEPKEGTDAWVIEKDNQLLGAALMETAEDDANDYIVHALALKEGVHVRDISYALLNGFRNERKYFIFGVADEKTEAILNEMKFESGGSITL